MVEIQRIDEANFDALLTQAREERWQQIVILSPVDRDPEYWHRWQVPFERAFVSSANVKHLIGRLRPLPGITSLVLWGDRLNAEDLRAVAVSLPNLTSLDLGYSHVADEGAREIAASFRNLTSLDLRLNNIGDEGARAIAASLHNLISLGLSLNTVGSEGARAIAASLHNLTSLNLSINTVSSEGARAIAASLHNLTSVDLRGNIIGIEGAKAVLDAWLPEQKGRQLRFLGLADNGLDDFLPKEVLETTDAQRVLAAYRRFVIAGR